MSINQKPTITAAAGAEQGDIDFTIRVANDFTDYIAGKSSRVNVKAYLMRRVTGAPDEIDSGNMTMNSTFTEWGATFTVNGASGVYFGSAEVEWQIDNIEEQRDSDDIADYA